MASSKKESAFALASASDNLLKYSFRSWIPSMFVSTPIAKVKTITQLWVRLQRRELQLRTNCAFFSVVLCQDWSTLRRKQQKPSALNYDILKECVRSRWDLAKARTSIFFETRFWVHQNHALRSSRKSDGRSQSSTGVQE